MNSVTQSVKSVHHKHGLNYTLWSAKKNSANYKNGWSCNICNLIGNSQYPNLYCTKCNFNLCENCKTVKSSTEDGFDDGYVEDGDF